MSMETPVNLLAVRGRKFLFQVNNFHYEMSHCAFWPTALVWFWTFLVQRRKKNRVCMPTSLIEGCLLSPHAHIHPGPPSVFSLLAFQFKCKCSQIGLHKDAEAKSFDADELYILIKHPKESRLFSPFPSNKKWINKYRIRKEEEGNKWEGQAREGWMDGRSRRVCIEFVWLRR